VPMAYSVAVLALPPYAGIGRNRSAVESQAHTA